MARAYRIDAEVLDWARFARWRDGKITIPSQVTTPTIEQLLDHLWENDMEIVRMAPQTPAMRTSDAITLVVDQAKYSTDSDDATSYLVDLLGGQVAEAFLEPAAGGQRVPLEWRSVETIRRWDPDWNTTNQRTGTPRFVTFDPEDGKFGVWPVPTAADVVRVYYQQEPAIYGLPSRWSWIVNGTKADGRTLLAVDLSHSYLDRPRNVNVAVATNDIAGPTAWAAETSYTAGNQVTIPSGNVYNGRTVVEAADVFTSAATWAEDAVSGNWTAVAWSGGTDTSMTITGGTWPDNALVTETVYLTGRAAGEYVPTQSFFWNITQVAKPNLSAAANGMPDLHLGSGDVFHTSALGRSVRTTSLIRPAWASRLSPLFVAALHRESLGDFEMARALMRRYEKNLESYLATLQGPMRDQYAFGRGETTVPEEHIDPWAVSTEMDRWKFSG